METHHIELLKRLIQCNVEFAVIGSMAAIYHGSSLVTHELDVAAPLDDQNTPKSFSRLTELIRDFEIIPLGRRFPIYRSV